MWTQVVAIAVIAGADSFNVWVAGMALLGGYSPGLSHLARRSWRSGTSPLARLCGWCLTLLARSWLCPRRILTAIVADIASPTTAIWTVAALTAISGTVIAIRTQETHIRTALT